jgi:hypothetical protein
MTLNLVWPRPEIYNSVPPFEWYLQWGGVIFVAAVIIGGTLLYRLKIRHQTGVLAEHAAAVAAHPSSAGAAQYGAAQDEAAQHEAAQRKAPEDALVAASEAS